MSRLPSRVAAVLAVALALLGARPAAAKGYLDDWHPYQTYWAVGWSAAVPVTALRAGFISDRLARGRRRHPHRRGRRLALGVSGTWTWLDQTFPSLSLEQPPSLTFTGPVYRRLSATTVLATAHYYLTKGDVQPFVGGGSGRGLDLDPGAGREPAPGRERERLRGGGEWGSSSPWPSSSAST